MMIGTKDADDDANAGDVKSTFWGAGMMGSDEATFWPFSPTLNWPVE